MDGEFVLDMDDVIQGIQKADVMSIFFPALRKSMVIDTRFNPNSGPMISLLPMVGSPEERLQSLGRLRPGFPQVNELTIVEWTRYVDSLLTLGVWDQIVDRFKERQQVEAVADCEKVLKKLRCLEREELVAVVLGTNHRTIWPLEEDSSL